MVLFKAILLGLIAWQVIELVRLRRKQKQTQPTYVLATTDSPVEKEMERSAPPAYYARV